MNRPEGLHCPSDDFYVGSIHPAPPVRIPHGHTHHARAVHGVVMAAAQTPDIMAIRCEEGSAGARQVAQSPHDVGGATLSFHPVGHVPILSDVSITETVKVDVKREGFSRIITSACRGAHILPQYPTSRKAAGQHFSAEILWHQNGSLGIYKPSMGSMRSQSLAPPIKQPALTQRFEQRIRPFRIENFIVGQPFFNVAQLWHFECL